MSTSDPRFSSAMEVIKLELEKLQNIKTAEMENVVRDRDSLQREVEELRSKKIKSDKIARVYKTRVLELEQKVLNAQAALSNSAAATPRIPFSNKRRGTGKRKAVGEYSGTEEEEAGDTYKSGVIKSEHIDNYNQAKTPYIRGVTYLIPSIINNVKKKLKKENSEKFEQSCFGHLLEIDKLKFQGQLVLQLLMHMDLSASNEERLVFKIKNSNIEFGPREFSLITGLRLGTLEAATTMASSSSIQERVFMGNDTILLKDIEDHFFNISSVGKGGDEMSLKLALLYFLYGILLAGNQTKQVDRQYLRLVEDLEEFYAFPWGRVAYEFLAKSMLLARCRIDDSEVTHTKRSKPNLTIYGFSLALQVWAYEMMPSLAEYCAIRANNPEHRIPRILRWSTLKKKKVCFKDLEKFFAPGDEAHLVLDSIRASPWELEALATGTIPPQPKKGTSLIDIDQILFDAATPISPTHHPARATTQTNANHVVQAETRMQPLVERCLFSAAGDVMMITSDSDDDDDDETAASNSSQSQDSDDALSDGYVNELVDKITHN